MRIKFNIEKMVEKNGITKRQLALQNGFTPEQIYHWQSNDHLPSVKSLVKIMRALDCDFYDIFEIVEE